MAWCARSLHDGTLVLAVDESDRDEDAALCVSIGKALMRERPKSTAESVTLALERYVRLHGVGASEEVIAAELWHMARHFTFKTGCEVYLPNLPEPHTPSFEPAALRCAWAKACW